MTSVFLVTNGGSGEDGDEWHLKSIHATRQGAEADAADANKQCGFNEWEAEEWAVQGSLLTDEERSAIAVARRCLLPCHDDFDATLGRLLERMG